MKRLLAMLAAAMLPLAAFSASYTNSFVRNGATYVQRGGLTIRDYVITNIDENAIGSSMTTNDVCNIVTNETVVGFTAWNVTPDPMQQPYALSWDIDWNGAEGDESEWSLFVLNTDYQLLETYFTNAPGRATSLTLGPYTATRSPIIRNSLGLARLIDLPPLTNDIPYKYQTKLPYPTNAIPYSAISDVPSAGGITTNDVCAIVTNSTVGGWSAWTCSPSEYQGFPIVITRVDDDWVPIANGIEIGVRTPDGSMSNLVWFADDEWAGTEDLVATRTFSVSRNVLGLAGEKGAVSEILMIGSDNKLYHFRIGTGGSIEVYMEVN